MGNAVNYDSSHVYNPDVHRVQFKEDGEVVLDFTVATNYLSGPSVTVHSATNGWQLFNGGTFLQTYGRGVDPPEWDWSFGGSVKIWNERYWGIVLKMRKFGTDATGQPFLLHDFGVPGVDWLWSKGEEVNFVITDEPDYWQ